MMPISGNNMELVPAIEDDREEIYKWLCHSDLTTSVMGPPLYPDHPVPSYQEFSAEYPLSFFNESADGFGKVFIIIVDGEKVGTVGYDLLDRQKGRVVLDIWMRAQKFCGRGYGSRALLLLNGYIHDTFGISTFQISPSGKNSRAIAAFQKAGFNIIRLLDRNEQEAMFGVSEYETNLLMEKIMVGGGNENH